MPRLQDIERFKRDLAGLSHEAEVLERWGEQPEAIPPPEKAAVPPRREGAEPQPRSPAAPAAGEEEGLTPDFAALLDGLPLDREGGEAPAPGSVDDELAALLGPIGEAGAGGAEPTAGEAAPSEEPIPLEEAFPLEEAPAEEEVPPAGFELPSDLELGLAPAEEPGRPESFEMPEAPRLPEPAEAAPAEAEGLDFELPSFDAEAPAAEAEELPEGGPVPAQAEEFTIPDFDLAEEGPGAAPPEAAPTRAAPAIPEEEPLEAEPAEAEPAPEPEAAAPAFGAGMEDAFESFSFEEPGAGSLGGFDLPSPGFGPGSARDLDNEIASLSEEAPVADTFKLDQDWGDFGALGTEGAKRPAPRPAPSRPAAPASAEKARPVSLTEAQVDRLQDSLLSYPLNLRVAVEDILANGKGSEAQQSRLVWSMVEGAPVEDVAILAGRVLKRIIPIPKGREKRTGAALEAERGTLAYAFVHTFLPVMKVGLIVLAAAAALGYLGWRFVYVPLAADSLYRAGYHRIAEDRYPEAETDFAKATGMREFVAWYYRYAEAYAAKRQYILAERKYASLVEAHPRESKGILAWARLEKEQLKYEEAVDVLMGAPTTLKGEAARGKTGLLSWDYLNEEGLLLLGDVYLDWAEEERGKYEDARRTYATLIERYGDKDAYLERMLLYFLRVDKLAEVLPLKDHFLAEPSKAALGPEVLAELGGYLMDKGMLDDVREMLLSAAKKGPGVPEAHYHLARYYRRVGVLEEERKALDNAIKAFAALPGLGGRRAGMYIDSLIWRGRFLVGAQEWVGAERDFAAAAAEYEKAVELRRVARSARFGEAYAGLADVAYLQRDDGASALALYDRAQANGYATPETHYRRGNILYRQGRYAESLEQLYEAGNAGAGSPRLDFAFGAAFLARSDWFSAEAYFRRAAAAMARLRDGEPEPMPQERPSETDVLKLYLRAENNLGVALYRSAARSGDSRRRNEAMRELTLAVRLYDQLAQAPDALAGEDARNLGLENVNALLQTGRGESLVAYTAIDKDMDFPGKD